MSVIAGDVEQVATGYAFTEGPVWLPDHQTLLFTDIPGNSIHAWHAERGASLWTDDAHFAIGLARATDGRVVSCEHSTRCLSALTVKADGSCGAREILARSLGGKVLNSTNDVICTSDGTILFTDPPFGVRSEDGELHGYQQAMEIPGCYVFKVGADADSPVPVLTDIYRPNGLCLSPDERTLYVSDSSERHHKVLAFDMSEHWQASNGRDFATMPVGVPDGMRVDTAGNLWVGGGDGVYVYAQDGSQIGHVPVPEMVTNVEFGGPNLDDLFITAVSSLYRVKTALPGGRAWVYTGR
jgi:gluconolactonase